VLEIFLVLECDMLEQLLPTSSRGKGSSLLIRSRVTFLAPRSPSQAANRFFETGEVFRKQASNGPVHDKRLLGLASHSI